MTRSPLLSWGLYPNFPQQGHSCHWQAEIARSVNRISEEFGTTLAYGNGRSYGDTCLAESGHVLHTVSLDRFIEADWENGVVIAEAGVTLEELLSVAIPNGWFLPVTPGTKYVTLGGAVANDVHGKNHHVRGTFGCHVRRFCLLRTDQPPLVCTLENESMLFEATIGGLGLTGIIAWVELQLIPIKSSQIDTFTVRFNSLSEFTALSNEFDNSYEYSVAWVDCLSKGKSLGRGVFIAGNHAESGELQICQKKKHTVPVVPPFSLMNPVSLRVFNTIYFHKHAKTARIGASDYDTFFYPLDGVLHWNRVYGSKGFQQYQCVVPLNVAESALEKILRAIADSGKGSFLAVLKKCGNTSSPGMMSFPLPGISLALDFTNESALETELFRRLDDIVRESRGRLYPAKDAHMSASDFKQFFPRWSDVERLRDPALLSRFWNRVITS